MLFGASRAAKTPLSSDSKMRASVGVTKKLAVCGRFEDQNFHQETIPMEMLEFVNRWLAAGS